MPLLRQNLFVRSLVVLWAAAYVLLGTGAIEHLHRASHGTSCTVAHAHLGDCASGHDTSPALPRSSCDDDCWVCVHLTIGFGAVAPATVVIGVVASQQRLAVFTSQCAARHFAPAETSARPPPIA